MSERDDFVYLSDILDSINLIEQHLGDKSLYEFDSNLMIQDAVIRRFEIIGEAANNISVKFREEHP